jgi:hypothetical protein
MNRFRRSRRTTQLSDSMHSRLNMYALAATAAGVASLALPQAVEAKIVYHAAHVTLDGPYPLDVNQDGIPDFLLSCQPFVRSEHVGFLNVSVTYNGANNVLVSQSQHRLPRDLKAGFVIGPWARSRFSHKDPTMAFIYTYGGKVVDYGGLWANGGKGVKDRYLGLVFAINGRFHYGWARFNVSFPNQTLKATLTGYAYETIPGKAIVAGETKGPEQISSIEYPGPSTLAAPADEPATLGLLALGASGLSIWRRKESVSAAPEGMWG